MLGMIVGVVLGGILGRVAPGVMLALEPIGKLFVAALALLAAAVIMSGMIVGISTIGDLHKLGRSSSKVLLYYLVTGLLTVAVGLTAVYVINPGDRMAAMDRAVLTSGQNLALGDLAGAWGSIGDLLMGLVVLSFVLGTALMLSGVKGRPVVTFMKALHSSLTRMVGLALFAAPFGLLFLVGSLIARGDGLTLSWGTAAGWYLLTVVIAFGVMGLIVLPLAARLLGGRSLGGFFGELSPSMLVAFGTASSAAALPFTYDAIVERGETDQRAGSLVLPLGLILNVGPTAALLTMTIVFQAQVWGVPLSILDHVVLVLASLALAIGLAGVPFASVALLSALVLITGLQGQIPAAGAPAAALFGLALLISESLRAAVNVCGDAAGAAVVGETFEFKTAKRTKTQGALRGPSRTTSQERRTAARSGSSSRRQRRPERDRRDRPAADSRSRQSRREPRGRSESTAHRDAPRGRSAEQSPFAVTAGATPALDIEPKAAEPTRSETPRPRSRPEPRPSQPSRQRQRRESPSTRPPKPRPRQEQPPAAADSDREGGQKRDRIQSELARVSAQLRPPDERPGHRREPAPDETRPRPAGDNGRRHELAIEPPAVEPPAVESRLIEPPAVEPPAVQPPTVEQSPVGESPFEETLAAKPSAERDEDMQPEKAGEEEKAPLTYGRSKARRRVLAAKKDGESNEGEPDSGVSDETPPDKEPFGEDSFTNQDISFGRGKRKRVR